MNKAKNGLKQIEHQQNNHKENEANQNINISKTDSSTQTEDDDENITKNYKRAFIIRKRPKLETILLAKYIPIIILMFISFYLYKKSLKGCELDESACLEAANIKKFYKYGHKLVLCASIVGFIFLLIFYNLISFFVQIPFFAIYAHYFYTYQGVDLRNHGIYNSILLVICSFIFFLCYLYLFKLCKFLYKHKIRHFIFLIIYLLFPLFFIYYSYITVECNKFYQGLNGLEISQNENENACYFPKPKFCTIKLFDNIFGLSKIVYLIKKGIPPLPYFTNYFYNKELYCINRDNSKSIFYEHANRKKRLNKFGLNLAFPDTSIFNFRKHSRVGKFHYKVFNRIYDYNKRLKKYNNSLNRKKRANPEIVVHFNNETDAGNLTMELRQDKRLIYKRRKLSAKYKVRYDNILFIFIDAVSKNHFKRKFPLTSNLLSKYLITNINDEENSEKNNLNNINAYQFLKYNNFRPSTQVNILPMFYGDSMKSQQGTSLIKYFKEKGYITGGSENICHKELFLLEQDKNKNVVFESFDHENFAMFCDPNYNPPNNRVSLFKGLFSMMRRCLYGKDTFDWVFEFGYKFLEKYKNERKFLRLGFIDGHEGTMEAVKYLDDSLYKFLDFYIKNYFSNSTAIFIASDHGENMVSIHHLLNSDEFLYERTLGTFFLLLPKIYEKPKRDYLFEKNLEIFDEDDDEDEEDEEEENDGINWSKYKDSDEFSFWKDMSKGRRGYFLDRDIYRINRKASCLFTDRYNKIKEKKEKKENKTKENNKEINLSDYNYDILGGTKKELKVYQDLKKFSDEYYLNSNITKEIKEDYSYDMEKIILDDNEFYLPYNKTAIFINQQRFITPYDIHDTMVYLVSSDYYWKSKKGQTLTEEIDGLKRNCNLYFDDFDNETINEYCRCIPFS